MTLKLTVRVVYSYTIF